MITTSISDLTSIWLSEKTFEMYQLSSALTSTNPHRKTVIRQHLGHTAELSSLWYNPSSQCLHQRVWRMHWFLTTLCSVTLRIQVPTSMLEHIIQGNWICVPMAAHLWLRTNHLLLESFWELCLCEHFFFSKQRWKLSYEKWKLKSLTYLTTLVHLSQQIEGGCEIVFVLGAKEKRTLLQSLKVI